MKGVVFLILIFLVRIPVYSQYCGNSGPQVCNTVYFPFDTAKLTDKSFDSLPCIVRGQVYNETINFRTDSFCIVFSGQYGCIQIYSYQIDSIWDLPQGICWATNKTTNQVTNGGWFCLNFNGVTNVPPGIYTAKMLSYASINVPTIPEIDPMPFRLMVVDDGASCSTISSVENRIKDSPVITFKDNILLIDGLSPETKIIISDLQGKILISYTVLSQTSSTIDVSSINGMFFVNIAGKDGVYTKKFANRY